MGFTCGIVGLPNCGKSTVFNAITQAGADSGNYMFTASEPNFGVVQVTDSRLETISQLVPAKNTVYTTMEFVDVPGLVADSSKGEGMGNQFLSHIRQVSAIMHVVRCFDDPNVAHIHNKIDPIADIEIVNTELIFADLDNLQKRKLKIEKLAKSGDKEGRFQFEILHRMIDHLENEKPLRFMTFETEAELNFLRIVQPLTTKPVLYLCNTGDPSETDSNIVKSVTEFALKESSSTVSLAGRLEAEIMDIKEEEERHIFMEELGLRESGLDRVVQAGYDLLDLITFFTVGGKENRAWTVRNGSKGPQAAGVIHSDFEKGFIRAKVYRYEDLMKLKTEQAIKEAGLLRMEGKDYTIQDGDIIEFLFNV
tara:strand:- start:11414 stop:12511 length:1098 start_codon:yes stop_codon:yes gene_type:complete